ncbi:MAG: hypothetical protein WCC15_04355, partial [Candidatus Acidiferrales bacterium]
GFWEGGPMLYVVVADQAKELALRENCCFVVQRTIAEVEGKPSSDALAVDGLHDVAGCNKDILRSFHDQKPVLGALGIPNAYRL